MSEPTVLVTEEHDVATITLNRPHRHNSFVPDMLEALLNSIRLCSEKKAVHTIVLRANGRSFSTGGDISAFHDSRDTVAVYADRLVGLLNDVMCSMFSCPQPIVTAVHGRVTGGALGLILAADIVVANRNASFTPYYVDVGFSPDGGWTAILPDIIGRMRASTVQQLNRTITAQQAFDWGLVTYLVENDDFDNELTSVCNNLRSKIHHSQSNTKALLVPREYRQRLECERRKFVDQITSDEARSGLAMFLRSMSSTND